MPLGGHFYTAANTLGYVSPFEFEAMYYDKINPLGQTA